jgi:hypothetical protein
LSQASKSDTIETNDIEKEKMNMILPAEGIFKKSKQRQKKHSIQNKYPFLLHVEGDIKVEQEEYQKQNPIVLRIDCHRTGISRRQLPCPP